MTDSTADFGSARSGSIPDRGTMLKFLYKHPPLLLPEIFFSKFERFSWNRGWKEISDWSAWCVGMKWDK